MLGVCHTTCNYYYCTVHSTKKVMPDIPAVFVCLHAHQCLLRPARTDVRRRAATGRLSHPTLLPIMLTRPTFLPGAGALAIGCANIDGT